jgi:predicted dehydrogenase
MMADRYPSFAIADVARAARDSAAADLPDAKVVSTTSDLEATGWPWHDTLAVIATWGPSHASLFGELANLGVRHILVEKPLANSIKAGQQMVAAAERHDIALGTHHTLRYSSFALSLKALTSGLGLGGPVSFVMHGGAGGLVTTGLHYIDLACEIFGAWPLQVISTVVGESINPRSPELMLYGGTAVWSFENGREAIISYNNGSSVQSVFSIYYRDAVIEVSRRLEIEVRLRDSKDVASFPAITRLGQPTDLVFKGSLQGVLSREEGTRRLLGEIETREVITLPPSDALKALEVMIAALESGRTGSAVLLPIDSESETGRTEWPIS